MKTLILTMLLLAIPQIVSAQVVMVQQRQCRMGACTIGIGSGVAIGWEPTRTGTRKYYVLTVAHNAGVYFKTRYNPRENYGMHVVTKSGTHPANIEQCSGPDFLMLLSFIETTGEKIPVLPIANRIPSAGEPVVIHGFSVKRTHQYGSRSLSLRSFGPEQITVNSPFEQGESGGPVIGKDGDILGLCEGHDVRSKVPWGPSAVAIRRFLNLPAIGAGAGGGETAILPVRPGVSLPPVGSVVPVPPPPKDDVPIAVPPVPVPVSGEPTPADVVRVPGRVMPIPEPDSISHPAPVASTNEAQPATGSQPSNNSTGSSPGNREDVPARIETAKKAIGFGMDIWSVLAGAGIVAGTGGIGGLALLAWRGLKAGKAVAHTVHEIRTTQQPATNTSTIASVIPPMVPLAPQSANFIQIPTDFRRASVDYALAETGRRYPGAIAAIEVVKSLINQHLQANGHGQETLHR